MHKLVFALPLMMGLAVAAGAAHAADSVTVPNDTTVTTLLGKDPGKDSAYACFVRHYDAPHLASHPKQNVRDIKVFVDTTYDADAGREYDLTVGVGFRKFKREFDISGGCQTSVDGKNLLNCGADCDGGHFDITTNGQSSIMLSIPASVRLWDPASTDDGPGDAPKGADFGSDDKLFKLDRAALDQCTSVMNDDEKAAIAKLK